MNSLNFNLYNVIILVGIVHGIIFSAIIFLNKKLNSSTNYFLAFTVLSLALSNLQYMFMDIGIVSRYQYETNEVLFIPFEFLMLPFFYLFVKSYLDKKINTNEKIFLFIPFVFCITYLLSTNHVNDDLIFIKLLNLVIEYLSIIYTVTIIFLIFRLIKIYEKQNSQYNSQNIIIETNWLKRMLYMGLILCFLWFLTLNIFESLFKDGYYKLYPLWIGISILIYWIAYSSIFQNNIYKEREEIRKKNKIILTLENTINQNKTLETSNNLEIINPNKFTEINNLIIENRLYLKPKLSLKVISKQINLSEGYLSQIINSNTNKNFNDYINLLRIENAKKLLIDKDYSKYTITAIGLESGFNTKASFYNAFKKYTGNTPNTYKKLVQNL